MTERDERQVRRRTKGLTSAILGVIAVCMSFQFGCKTGPTEPGIENPRAHIWTVDTLRLDPVRYPGPWQILVQSMWGSATDLYAVGHSDGSAGTMWHFDGNNWSNVRLGVFEGGPIPAPYDLSAIHGVSPDNIYAVGERYGPTSYGTSFVVHFDGKQWKEEKTPGGYRLMSVWANAVNDVWACGLDKTVLHYNGVEWTIDSVTFITPEGSQNYLGSIAGIQGNEMFMLGTAYHTSPTFSRWNYFFFRRQENTWKLVPVPKSRLVLLV